ncbi:MAG: helix-turn-helix transcriptional regulator [Spirochaetaceae bacterium]|nr:helix-turn-helix transcriptional regulator [Spirochaetaceae bacterium]
MTNSKETVFSRRVKELMRENRYSQKKLCEICGITEAAFSRYMTSGRIPRTDVLANIANTLHTTSDYLLGNESKYGYDQLEIILASSKDNLSLNQKKKLVEILMEEYKNAQNT